MTLCCVLTLATLFVDTAAPNPAPVSWTTYARRIGDPDFDSFAIKAVGLVRRADWDGVSKLCRKTISFEVCEARPQTEEASKMLFDDTNSTQDEPLMDYHLKSLSVDTSTGLSGFASTQFSFFASLVEESTESAESVPHWGYSTPDEQHQTYSGPAIWGPYASNAFWRIEVGRFGGSWKIEKFVVEYHG